MRGDIDELTQEERDAFAGLPRETALPAGLEDRVVSVLRERGVLRATRRRRAAAMAAAMVLLVALAYFAGRFQVATPGAPATPPGQTFALLIFDRVDAASDEVEAAAVADAIAWARELASAEVLLAAERLGDEASRLELRAGRVVPVAEGTASPSDRRVGGFFLIRAASYEEAQAIAAGCPLLRYGSTVEIRAVD